MNAIDKAAKLEEVQRYLTAANQDELVYMIAEVARRRPDIRRDLLDFLHKSPCLRESA